MNQWCRHESILRVGELLLDRWLVSGPARGTLQRASYILLGGPPVPVPTVVDRENLAHYPQRKPLLGDAAHGQRFPFRNHLGYENF
jgi:hypothetical protein